MQKRPAVPSTTLDYDWSLFVPLEAVTQVFVKSLCERPKRADFVFSLIKGTEAELFHFCSFYLSFNYRLNYPSYAVSDDAPVLAGK